MAKGMVKGALHTEGLDDILTCVEDPINTLNDIRSAISHFEKQDFVSTTQGFMDMGSALSDLLKAIKHCSSAETTKEFWLLAHMITAFKAP